MTNLTRAPGLSPQKVWAWRPSPGHGQPGCISLIVNENADRVILSAHLPRMCQCQGSRIMREKTRIRLFRLGWPPPHCSHSSSQLPLVLNEQKLLKAVYPIRVPMACVTHSLATSFWMHLPNIHCFRPTGQEISICSKHTVKKHPNPKEPMSQRNPRVTHQHRVNLAQSSFSNSLSKSSPGRCSMSGTVGLTHTVPAPRSSQSSEGTGWTVVT